MKYQTMPALPLQPGEMLLPLERIMPRPSLMYAREPTSLRRLAESIRVQGLCKPLIVRRAGDGRYVVAAGNRRLMACRMLGLQQAPVRVLPGDLGWQPAEALMELLITRRGHYLEAAEALRALRETHGMSQAELAAVCGMHPGALAEQIRLTTLTEEERAILMDEGVPMCIALTLLRLPEQEQRMAVLQRIVQERLCVRDAALVVSAELRRQPCVINRVPKREETKPETEESRNATRKVIGVIRDQRLYINALRNIAGQMQSAGVHATIREEQKGSWLEMTIRVSTRRRRAARYQSM